MVHYDNFLESYDELREFADNATYDGIVNPVDGVVYPGICMDLPERPEIEIYEKLLTIMGPITPKAIFMRLSTAGTPIPQQAHSDVAMGRWSMMLYLNRPEHCRGGTALLEHKETRLRRAPKNHDEAGILLRDQNVYHAWRNRYVCKMVPNRACIFKAHLLHRAEPVGGFGSNAKDGRLVLTCFFD